MEDASLDDFLDGADGADTAPSSDAGTEAVIGDPVAGPVTVTYRVSPDGTRCEECGCTVNSRWRDGEAFRCADCKTW